MRTMNRDIIGVFCFLLLVSSTSNAEPPRTVAVFAHKNSKTHSDATMVQKQLENAVSGIGLVLVDPTDSKTNHPEPRTDEQRLIDSIKADIYVVFEIKDVQDKLHSRIELSSQAFETTTNRYLAKSEQVLKFSTDSKESRSEELEQAVQILSSDLAKQLSDSLVKKAKELDAYHLYFYNPPKHADVLLSSALSRSCSSVRISMSSSTRLSLVIQCQMPTQQFLDLISETVKSKLSGINCKVTNMGRNSWMFDFQPKS